MQKHDVSHTKLVKLAPWIYKRANFYFRDHPMYHPDTQQYMDYWEEHERRSVEGMWILNQDDGIPGNSYGRQTYDPAKPGGWMWLSPQHYWYLMFCLIKADDDGSVEAQHPDLRDVDKYLFNIYTCCWGFSGMSDDLLITCNNLVKKYIKHDYSIDSFTPKERIRWNKLQVSKEIYQPNGELKKYVEPLKYIQSNHKVPKGRHLYNNVKKNFMFMTPRRQGKSYINSGLLSQRYNFHHKDTYEDYLNTKLGPNLLVGSASSSKSGELLNKFKFSQDNLTENFGSFTDDDGSFTPGFFYKSYMGTLNISNEKNPYRYVYKHQKGKTWVTGGTRTAIVHGSYESNSQVFVGQLSPCGIEDEVGINPKLRECLKHDEPIYTLKEKEGICIKSGTGGEMKYAFESKVVFYDPHTYQFFATPNHWENENQDICTFIPSYYTDNSFRDPNGNQNIELAYEQELLERKRLAESNNTSALDGYIINRPLIPSEIFLSPETNIFPVTLIKEHMQDMELNKTFKTIASIGHLTYTDPDKMQVKWTNYEDTTTKPILTWDFKKHEGNLESSIVIFEHPPAIIPNPTFGQSMYKIGYDPVNDDFGGTSLASIYVFKSVSADNWNSGVQNTIVACYNGRYDSVDDIHDIAIKLAIYYNAKILPETNLPDFVRYAKRRGCYGRLQLTPYDAISTLINGNRTNKMDVGMRVMKSEKLQGEQLIRQWLLEERGVDPITGKKILNLHHIYCPRILDELINYTRDNNTDAISAFILLMFWIFQERVIPIKSPDTVSQTNSAFDVYYKNVIKGSTSNKQRLIAKMITG
jgi:hypothetical protein